MLQITTAIVAFIVGVVFVQKSTSFLSRHFSLSKNSIVILAIIQGFALYVFFKFVYQILYAVAFPLRSEAPWFWNMIFGMDFVTDPVGFLAFFLPVIFYQWHRIGKERNALISMLNPISAQNPGTSSFSVYLLGLTPILVVLVSIALTLSGVLGNEASGVLFLSILFSGPIFIALPAGFLFWLKNHGTEQPATRVENIFLISVMVLSVLAFVGVSYWEHSSTKKVIQLLDEQSRGFEQSLVEQRQKIAQEESVPPPPSPHFDSVVEEARQDLASHLDVPSSKIATASYHSKYTGIKSVEDAFCILEEMKPVFFRDLSPENTISSNGDVRVLNENTAILYPKSTMQDKSNPDPYAAETEMSLPIMLSDPLPTHISFDYHYDGDTDGDLFVSLDNRVIEGVRLSEGIEFNRGLTGFIKDKRIVKEGFKDQPVVTPGLHRLDFMLRQGTSAQPFDGKVEISRVRIGQASTSPYPCVSPGSENRRVIFSYGTSRYGYVMNISGKYFREGELDADELYNLQMELYNLQMEQYNLEMEQYNQMEGPQ